MPFIPSRAVAYTPSDLHNHLIAATVGGREERGLQLLEAPGEAAGEAAEVRCELEAVEAVEAVEEAVEVEEPV